MATAVQTPANELVGWARPAGRVLLIGESADLESALRAWPDCDLSLDADGEEFDTVVLAAPLEGTDACVALLSRARAALAEGGSLVARAPNATFAPLRLTLLAGAATDGAVSTVRAPLARGALRDLLEGAGYVVTSWERWREELGPLPGHSPSQAVPEPVWTWLVEDPEATTREFAVRASASDASSQVTAVRADLAESERRVAELEGRLAAAAEREAGLRKLLLDRHDGAVRREDEVKREVDAEVERQVTQAVGDVHQAMGERDAARAEVDWMKSRRIWRVGTQYWKLKSLIGK